MGNDWSIYEPESKPYAMASSIKKQNGATYGSVGVQHTPASNRNVVDDLLNKIGCGASSGLLRQTNLCRSRSDGVNSAAQYIRLMYAIIATRCKRKRSSRFDLCQGIRAT